MDNVYTNYYKELCPNEESWVHTQLSNEREELEDEMNARVEMVRLGAEVRLAAERARLDWLLSRMGGNVLPANKCVAWTVDVFHYENRFPSRAAIDAAMKEGA